MGGCSRRSNLKLCRLHAAVQQVDAVPSALPGTGPYATERHKINWSTKLMMDVAEQQCGRN